MNRNKAYILCPAANSSPIYQSWLPFVEHVLVDEYSDQWQPPEDCGIVISHLHYDYPTATILSRLTKQNRVPVLVLADGVLEFRNTYQNPTVAAGSIFMPVHGHKLACIGNSQARVVSSWDNAGKCEIVGLPRFDQLNDIRKKGANSDKQQDPNSFRILVATARKPGFDTRQIETVRRSLMDLKKHFDSTPVIHNKRLEITWRLTGDLEQSIGVNQEPVRRRKPADPGSSWSGGCSDYNTIDHYPGKLASRITNRNVGLYEFTAVCPHGVEHYSGHSYRIHNRFTELETRVDDAVSVGIDG